MGALGILLWWGLSSAPRTVAARSTADAGHLAPGEHRGELSVNGGLDVPLRPGTDGGIDVQVANSTSEPVELRRLEVRVEQVDAPRATAVRGCGSRDFEVVQGDLEGLVVDGSSATSLSQAGVGRHRWPRLRMVDRDRNQDGCQDARVVLAFAAEGTSA